VEHAGELDVGRELHLPTRPRPRVHSLRRSPDGLERARRPGVKGVLLDDDPLLRESAFDFLFGADQPRQFWIASSILG
jgi:hypothetical protein